MSIAFTLAIVLGLMGIALRVLRKYAVGGASARGAIKMEVVQRLTLGQRQGIAVVRIGTRVLAVSMGDGGVHPVAELDASELVAVPESEDKPAITAAQPKPWSLGTLLGGLRTQKAAPEPQNAEVERISYVAPIEDFQAVLNMAMNGGARA